MTQRTAEEFQQHVRINGIEQIHLRDCSMCGYPIVYLFRFDKPMIDTGCFCTGRGSVIRTTTWEDIASHYNRNQPENNPAISPEWVAETDTKWGFTVKADR